MCTMPDSSNELVLAGGACSVLVSETLLSNRGSCLSQHPSHRSRKVVESSGVCLRRARRDGSKSMNPALVFRLTTLSFLHSVPRSASFPCQLL